MELFFYTWVARYGARVIALDGGADQAEVEGRGHEWIASPAATMRGLGLSPESVSDLVISHVHWDHAGNLDLFPRARVWVSRDDVAFAHGPAQRHPFLRRPYVERQLAVLDAVRATGRVSYIECGGIVDLDEGLTVHALRGHTAGNLVVCVPTSRGQIVLAADCAHYLRNLDLGVPFPAVLRTDQYLDSLDVLVSLAGGDQARIVPGHDPAVAMTYPSPAGISHAFALHVAPDTTATGDDVSHLFAPPLGGAL
jgi:glyoxylase-like metal-dependent hydrolase (beta-lactamase superfamily II)